MLSDWSIAGTRGRSLIYHLIHPNSHPDVLWPLFTLSLTHTHTQTCRFIIWVHRSFPLSAHYPFFCLTHTHTHTEQKIGSLVPPLFLPSCSSDNGIDNLPTYTHTQASEGGACDLSGIEKASSTADFKDAYLGFVCFWMRFLFVCGFGTTFSILL